MAVYGEFADVYDLFMDNVDYPAWSRYLVGLLKKYGISDGLILDLGCGTGTMTELLADAGYDMIGVDSSVDMLQEALKKRDASGHDILYLEQDMRSFELYGTVRAVVSVCDCLNYMTEPEDLLAVFRLVNNYLDPGGMFIFDLNTVHKYEEIGEQTIAENRDEGSFIWENLYDPEQRLNEYILTLFLREGKSGLYRKEEEIHVQRAYTLEEIKDMLHQAGMDYLGAFAAYTDHAPEKTSDRILVIAREHGKAPA